MKDIYELLNGEIVSLEVYKCAKINLLRQLHIKVDETNLARINDCTTEIQVDNICKGIRDHYYNSHFGIAY